MKGSNKIKMVNKNNKLNHHLFTSESVAPGHPDKICDQISDAVLDAILAKDSNAKVACEVFITTNYLLIGGEVHSNKLNFKQIKEIALNSAHQVLNSLEYNNYENGFDVNNAEIKVLIHEQSNEILQGVELKNHEIGAGDQGIMFGYACCQSSEYMPLAITIAHELLKFANDLRKKGSFLFAKTDMKAQVTIDQEDENNLKIHTILMSVQHSADYDEAAFKKFIHGEIMVKVAEKFKLNTDFDYLINPTGAFVIGGPNGDTGLTGRKIMVDTYGGAACHGGGAFSGKDPTKVDRSAAYYARYIAKNIVAAKLARECQVQLAYAIGKPLPIAIHVNTNNTIVNNLTEQDLSKIVYDNFDCSLKNIINELDLKHQKYYDLATYGHFGRSELNLPWEKLDKVEKLKKYLV